VSNDPFLMFLGVRQTNDPFALLGLSRQPVSVAQVEAALHARLGMVFGHVDGRGADAEIVRQALRQAAEALRDPVRQQRQLTPWSATPPSRWSAPRPRASIALTPFDRLVMGVLVGSGGWNAQCRSRLVAIAASYGVTVQGLIKVIRGLSDYAKAGGPRLGVAEITGGAERLAPPVLAEGSSPTPAWVESLSSQFKAGGPLITIKLSIVFGALTLLGCLMLALALSRGGAMQRARSADQFPQVSPVETVESTAVAAPAGEQPIERGTPAAPTRFTAWPTFAAETEPQAARETAGRIDSIIDEGQRLARQLSIAPEASDAMVRTWRAVIDDLGSAWPMLKDPVFDASRAMMKSWIYAASASPATTTRLLADLTPPSNLQEPLDLWRGAWKAGVLGDGAAAEEFPPLLVDLLQQSVIDAAGQSIDQSRVGFHAVAGTWLDRTLPQLVAMIGQSERTYAAWELWLTAQRRLRSGAELEAAIAGAIEAIASSPRDLADQEQAHAVLARLLEGMNLQSSAWRERLRLLFESESLAPSRNLSVVTALLAAREGEHWFSDAWVLSPDADAKQRRRTWAAISAGWPGRESNEPDRVAGAAVAVDPELFTPWTDLLSRSLGELERVDAVGAMGQVVTASWLNEAAAWIAAGDAARARAALDRTASAIEAIAAGKEHPGVVASGQAAVQRGQAIGMDGQWAAMYQELGADVEGRLRALEALRNTAGTDLGPLDARTLVRELYRGRTQDIRDAAAALVLSTFPRGPIVALQMLDQLPNASPGEHGSEVIGRLAGAALPAARSAAWMREARLALVRHALKLRDSPAAGTDAAAEAVLASLQRQAEALGMAASAGKVAGDPQQAATAALAQLRAMAAARLTSTPVPAPVGELDRRHRARLSLAEGPLQRFAALRLAALDLLAYITAAERPEMRRAVIKILAESFRDRGQQTRVLRQIVEIERAMAGLWQLRLEQSPPRQGTAGASQRAEVVVAMLAATSSSSDETAIRAAPRQPDEATPIRQGQSASGRPAVTDQPAEAAAAAARWTPRLEALRPDKPMAYFDLAEEMDDAATTSWERARARELFALAGVLDPDRLGGSACLALADLETDDLLRRRLRGMAPLLGQHDAAGLLPSPEPTLELQGDAAVALSESLSDFRQGLGGRALARLQQPEVMKLLRQCDAALPGGADRVLEDCKRYRGGLSPMLSDTDVTNLLRLELALLAGADRPWSSELLLTEGRPLIEADPDRLEQLLGVDARAAYFRGGRWQPMP
jgi:hypothetical protein